MFNPFTQEELDNLKELANLDPSVFYYFPKELLTNSKYNNLNTKAILLYGYLLDLSLSSLRWTNDQGHVCVQLLWQDTAKFLMIQPTVTNTLPTLLRVLKGAELIEITDQKLGEYTTISIGNYK